MTHTLRIYWYGESAMSDGDGKVQLKIEAPNGVKIEVSSPPGDLGAALEQALQFANGMNLGRLPPSPQRSDGEVLGVPAGGIQPVVREKRPKVAKASSSTGRSGRLGSFEPQKDLLDEKQQMELRAFRVEKAPADQSDEVLVAMYKGENLLGRQGFTYNEIYTLMWRAGVEPLPKALDVVVQKLVQEQLVERGGDGYFLKFLGRNRIERDLPLKGDKAA